ncbi:MAG: hypothetical protein MI864_01370 [Pseudomonadales bacterium]|nr:hypothetical protein [Pseudomonadales bacterium]
MEDKKDSRTESIQVLRRILGRKFRAKTGSKTRIVARLVAQSLWYWRQLKGIYSKPASLAQEVWDNYQISPLAQNLMQLRLCLLEGISAIAYYRYRFYIQENYANRNKYLYGKDLNKLVWLTETENDLDIIKDKWEFSHFCDSQDLPVVVVFGRTIRGEIKPWPGINNVFKKQDLFVKPVSGTRGEGCELWRWCGGGYVNSKYDGKFSAESFAQYLVGLPHRDGVLIQPKVLNHDGLVALSNGAAVTARIVSVITATGDVQIIRAVCKMPFGRHYTNNLGLNSAINLPDGCLGPAYRFHPGIAAYTNHPDTGESIEGVHLPDWEQAKALVVAAHHAFSAFFSLGWDVVFTQNGPKLLEVNRFWDTDLMQFPFQAPLEDSDFARIAIDKIKHDLNHR